MHLLHETSKKSDMIAPAPFGPGFSESEARRAAKMRVTVSGIGDPGTDKTEFELLDENGDVLAHRMLVGY